MIKKLGFIISLFLFCTHAYAGTISFDQLQVSGDLTTQKYNADLNRVYQEMNTNIESSNIAADTIDESDMSDNINPRIRTYEGASCEYVDDGLLNATTVGTLSGAIPSGTAYPRGFRCDKTSSTARTWTASRWTWLDIDQNCDFQFTEQAIDSSTPAVASNSIRISRVSTDGTQVAHVQDLRTTSCTGGPFENIADLSGEATLDDLLSYGRDRVSADEGFVRGLQLSWDGLTTTFSVLSGASEVNGKFRRNTSTTSVPQTADNPTQSVSGIDTGAIAASTRYYVYAAADQDAVQTMSVSISTNRTTPTGITNFRRIGELQTDSSSNFISRDMLTYHVMNRQEIIQGWVTYGSTNTTIVLHDAFNVSSFTDTDTGDVAVTWDTDFKGDSYVVTGSARRQGATTGDVVSPYGHTPQLVNIKTMTPATDADVDAGKVSVIATGE